MEEEEEARASYCREMIRRVRLQQQQQLGSPGEEEEEEEENRRDGHAGGHRRRGGGRQVVVAGGEMADYTQSNLPLLDGTKRHRQQPSLGLVCQGPEVRSVPLQLISMLRLQTFKADARRAAEVELHDPAVCSACEQEQASLALTTFIWRKKTQLHMQTLKGRLNTHSSSRDRAGWTSLCKKNLPKPSNAPHWIWEGLLGEDMRVTATWGYRSNQQGTWSCPGNR
ncbi:uncharacterized protein LOC118112234 [Hippoglossus stenolepis]|uniref:uncharacterized protein LOC118112234 n=1 Tax=Hippoglossus stenolepis TaxID=195615 RepID=UPI00159C7D48|nr:uncharacterized protein LOC118112234 [Hippoglossus stenolepis]